MSDAYSLANGTDTLPVRPGLPTANSGDAQWMDRRTLSAPFEVGLDRFALMNDVAIETRKAVAGNCGSHFRAIRCRKRV